MKSSVGNMFWATPGNGNPPVRNLSIVSPNSVSSVSLAPAPLISMLGGAAVSSFFCLIGPWAGTRRPTLKLGCGGGADTSKKTILKFRTGVKGHHLGKTGVGYVAELSERAWAAGARRAGTGGQPAGGREKGKATHGRATDTRAGG